MSEPNTAQRFETMAMPHLDAAYNLARWITRNPHDADDVVQDAWLRAFRFFGSFRGGDGRAWLLTIVRHCAYSWLRQNRYPEGFVEFDDEIEQLQHVDACDNLLHAADPQGLLIREDLRSDVEAALLKLPAEFREVLVLRELEELSYKEIAAIVGIPAGTVMSRLSRARLQLRRILQAEESR